MGNFGFNKLVLVNPPALGGEARARAMHAQGLLADACVFDSFAQIEKEYDTVVGFTAEYASDKNYLRNPVLPEDLAGSLKSKGNIALVFGREDYGLLNEELLACDMLVSIPASKDYPTLNLAVSVAIILYELSRLETRTKLKEMKKFRQLSGVEKNVLLDKYDNLVDLVHAHDFDRRIAKKTFKQLVGRAFISGREATNLTGVFRKASEKIKKTQKK